MSKLWVSEIFYSVQGEGIHLGKPAIFLRLSGCNLRCVWCDTKYALDMKSGKCMSLNEVLSEIQRYPAKHIVVTGGEPLLQQLALIPLLKELKKLNFFIELETNGSIEPVSNLVKLVDQFNVSPKLSNAGLPKPVLAKSIYHVLASECKAYFKFVVISPSDLLEIDDYVTKYYLPRNKVILMPQAMTSEEHNKRLLFIIEHAKNRGYRVTPRLQIIVYGGGIRGV